MNENQSAKKGLKFECNISTAVNLSTQITEARRKLGLTQEQASKAWSVPISTLRQWEQEQRSPRGLALVKLHEIIAAALAAKPASESAASPTVPSPASAGGPPRRPAKRKPKSSPPPPKAKRRRLK